MPNLICIKPFGDYKVGDEAGEVPEDAAYCTEFFAPTGTEAAHGADKSKAELEAELAALEGEAK